MSRTRVKSRRLSSAWFQWFNDQNFEGGPLDSRLYRLTTADVDFEAISIRGGVVYVMHVEVKSNGERAFTWSNVLSTWIVRSTFERSSGKAVQIGPARGETRLLRYLGFHVLTFDGETPGDSALIEWNGEPVSLGELFRLLRMEIDPVTFQPLKK